MKQVKVLKVPVRYNGVTHARGASFVMEDDHVNESIVEVLGEVAENNTPSQFEGKTLDDLKAYAEEYKIDIGKATTEEGIIKKIEEAQKAE
ncbi:hypothetical protein [Psychrobacillus sp. BM2]|uniref:hypothetical protein n=1 Tax=Psychrobacillus sp. BM2 TaxID=3400421 RepID=UPI003B02B02B